MQTSARSGATKTSRYLATALTELSARLKIGEGSVETLEIEIDARTIHNIEIGAWRTPNAAVRRVLLLANTGSLG
jgi:hypothetical protein